MFIPKIPENIPATDFEAFTNPKEAVDRLEEIYSESIEKTLRNFKNYLDKKIDLEKNHGDTCYPYLLIQVNSDPEKLDPRQAYGFVRSHGTFGATITRPDIFRSYYEKQIELLIQHHDTPVFVGKSKTPIPIHFALPTGHNQPSLHIEKLSKERVENLSKYFATPDLSEIHDSIANGIYSTDISPQPLSLFTAERVDISLQRLRHYTGTAPKHFQKYILLTNYGFYVDEFIRYGKELLKDPSQNSYDEFVEPGNIITSAKGSMEDEGSHSSSMPQMPAYHLKAKDNSGITLINIGVGPSNARTITDHVAVLRPHCWLMLGHCAGLRRTQRLGDYVLAHGYVREDKVLDDDLPLSVPVPPLAEIQQDIHQAVEEITGASGYKMKSLMRTGTIASFANRNWEFDDFTQSIRRLSQSRTIAVDMESATIAANGLRLRVPYGTLLCVSDKPLHGELKLPGMANDFYKSQVNQHLKIGIRSLEILKSRDIEELHSRKLRSQWEPAFQ